MTLGLLLVNFTIRIESVQEFKHTTHPTLVWCRIKGCSLTFQSMREVSGRLAGRVVE